MRDFLPHGRARIQRRLTMGTIRDFAVENGIDPAKLAKHMIKVRAELITERKHENKWVVAYMAIMRIKCKRLSA